MFPAPAPNRIAFIIPSEKVAIYGSVVGGRADLANRDLGISALGLITVIDGFPAPGWLKELDRTSS